MSQAPLLGAPPSSSVLRSLLRLPCSPPLRFSASASAVLPIAHASLCRGSHSLPPETPPLPQARPSRSTSDQRASRRPRGAGSPAPTEADPGEGSPEEAGGCRLLFYVSGGGGRREGPGPFSWKGGSGRFFHKRGSRAFTPKRGVEGRSHGKGGPLSGIFFPHEKRLIGYFCKSGAHLLKRMRDFQGS